MRPAGFSSLNSYSSGFIRETPRYEQAGENEETFDDLLRATVPDNCRAVQRPYGYLVSKLPLTPSLSWTVLYGWRSAFGDEYHHHAK